MNKLYEVVELCLQEIEQGVDVDTVLFRYPELADELRPILEASVKAREMAVPEPSQEVVRRNRAKLLQHAAELRERKAAPSARRIWSVPLRRALVSLSVIVMLFVSSTGLVRASSNTLPGDNLYPVKRTWEGVLLFFTFDTNKRETLELEHENERLEELQELFIKGRSADVKFTGYVTRQSATEWRVAGITVLITPETRLPIQTVDIGAAVRIVGKVQEGVVIAERIELLAPGSIVPDVDDEDHELEIEDDEEGTVSKPATEIPVTGLTPEATVAPVIKTPTPKFDPKDVTLEGVVTSIKNDLIVVNGVVMDISSAEEVKGSPSVGAAVKVEGYYDASGIFIVTKIEFKTGNSNSGGGSDNGNASNENSNDNQNGNDNNNNDDDSNSNDNDNDDDNSGSGGGDDD